MPRLRYVSWPISIHALREEGDLRTSASMPPACRFLSTPSARRATGHPQQIHGICLISIHALREEGDSLPSTTPASSKNFYPRPPRGGRHQHSGGGLHNRQISIHALREEGDISYSVEGI